MIVPLSGIILVLQVVTGVLLVALTAFTMLQKRKHGIRVWQTWGSAVSASHYGLLGLWTGCAIGIVSSFSAWTLGAREDTREVPTKWVVIYMACAAALLFPTWEGPVSLAPATATLGSLASMWLKNPKRIIQSRLVLEPIWIVYNAIGQAWFPLTASLVLIAACAWNLWHWERGEFIPGKKLRGSGQNGPL